MLNSFAITPSTILHPELRASTRYQQGLEKLVAVVQQLSLCRTMDQITEVVRTAARQLMRADGATFVLNDHGFCRYIDEDAIGPLWKGSRFPMKSCISGWVMTNRTAVVIEDVYKDPRIPVEVYKPTFVKSLAMVPIRGAAPVGAIGAYWAKPHQATRQEVELLRALADTTSVALENVRVYAELEQRVQDRTRALEQEIAERKRAEQAVLELSLKDELTGLYNRRGFMLLAGQEWKVAQRTGVESSVVFIDLDGLKHANDTHGHEVGDQLIIEAGQVLRKTFRDADVLARLGGDEFVVFALGCPADATAVRNRLATHAEKVHIPALGNKGLSMSVGVVACDPTATLDQLLARADAAMYVEKRARRATRTP